MDKNERTPTLYMMRGLPASGKTTLAKKMVAEDPNIKRVNRDELRLMIQDGNYHPQLEVFVRVAEDAILQAAWHHGHDVVIDDTNLKPENEAHWREAASLFGYEFEILDIDTPVEVCIERDAAREKPVGAHVIETMHQKYCLVTN